MKTNKGFNVESTDILYSRFIDGELYDTYRLKNGELLNIHIPAGAFPTTEDIVGPITETTFEELP